MGAKVRVVESAKGKREGEAFVAGGVLDGERLIRPRKTPMHWLF